MTTTAERVRLDGDKSWQPPFDASGKVKQEFLTELRKAGYSQEEIDLILDGDYTGRS